MDVGVCSTWRRKPDISGKVKAFAHFGVKLTNDVWSWSGQAPDGRIVLTVWTDEMNYKASPPSCSCFGHPQLSAWTVRPGNRERIAHLKNAREHRQGQFNVVMVKAKDTTVSVRSIEEAYPTNLIMRLKDLNEETGEFSAEVIGKEE